MRVRNGIADADHRFEEWHTRVRGVQHEVRLGEEFQAAEKVGVRGLLRDVASPQVPVADPTEQRVLVVSLQVLRKLRLVWLQVADHADHDRITLGDLEHPEVVLDPRARLDMDRADDAERDRERAIALRVGGDRSGARRRLGTAVRRALRARRIEEVNMGVDDRNGRRLRLRARSCRRQRGGGNARQEGTA